MLPPAKDELANWLIPFAVSLLLTLSPAYADTSKRCEEAFARANHYIESPQPDYPAAIESYNTLLADCPGFDRGDAVAQNLSAAYLHLNPPQFEKAIKALQDGMRGYPHSGRMVDLQVALGMAYIADADYMAPTQPAQAKSLYSAAVETLQKVQGQVIEAQSRWQLEFNLANARFNMANYVAAVVTYHSLLKSRPPAEISIPALYNSGTASLNLAREASEPTAREGAYSQALESFQQLVNQYPQAPNAAEARLQLARTQLGLKKTEPAVRLLKELTAAAEKGVSTAATYELAMFDVSQHQYDDALPLLQRYVQDSPGTPEADGVNVQIGYILLTQKNDREAALAAYRAAAAGDSSPAALQGQRGEMAIASRYLQEKHFEKAAAVYKSLVNVPDLKMKESALYGQALSLINLKDSRAAESSAEYLQAFPLSSGAASIMYQLGVEQFNNHDYVPALRSFSQAAAVNPEGSLSPEAKQDAAALKSAALYWAGTAAWQAQQTQPAIANWEQELKSDPSYERDLTGDTLLSLSRAEAVDGRYSDAVERLQLALQHYPGKTATADALLEIAGLASNNNHPEVALQLYATLIAAAPKSISAGAAQYNLGVAYLKLNPPEPDKALKAFQDYQAMFPRGPLASNAAINEGQEYEAMARRAGSGAPPLLEHALAAYRNAAALTSDSDLGVQAAWRVGAIEGKLNHISAAIEDLDRAIARFPNTGQMDNLLFEKAHVLQEGQQDSAALAAFQSYLARFAGSPNAPAARFNLAMLQYNLARVELARLKKGGVSAAEISARKQVEVDFLKAAKDFDTALASGASSVPADAALYYEACALTNGRQPAQALLTLRRLLKEHPESAHATEAAAQIAAISKGSGTQ